ncbi:MAG: hypothetical protein ACKVWR_13515 [Acidimicrobiales bacterium]
MAQVDPAVVEMPSSLAAGLMPPYARLAEWMSAEVAGLGDSELDFCSTDPTREWMWWSIRRQVSHVAWDALVFSHRRCAPLLWPDGNEPEPISWRAAHLGPDATADRLLDEARHHDLGELLDLFELGLSWLERVVAEQPIDALRANVTSVRGTWFWQYVIQVLPRGAGADPDRPGFIRYTLEASLWMVFYEVLAHIRTVQRLKAAQGLAAAVELPRVGYLRLPEYWGDADRNGPSFERLPT